jgi:hypothetical protein
MRKVIAAIFLLCGLTAHAQFAAYWNFVAFNQQPEKVRQVNLIELWNIVGNSTNIVVGQRQPKQTDLNGTLTVSNMVPGAYRIEFIGVAFTNSFTNVFGTSTTGLTNALFAIGVSTNSVTGDGYAYTRNQVDALLAGFSGGSATNAYQSQVSGVGILIATNLTTFVYTISLNASLQLWSAFTPTAYSNGLYSVFSVADNLASGTVPPARLGSGSSIATKFLRGDSTWQPISGGGDMLAANNLSELTASAATARGNIGASASATTVTVAGTANQITSSAGAQDLSANRTWTLSFPSVLILPGSLNVPGNQTNQGNFSLFGVQTNFSDLYIRGNGFMGGNLLATTNQLIDGSALKASQFVATDGSTNFVSTQNGLQLTNTFHFTNYLAQTNIILQSDGTQWTGLITNGPDVFISFAGNAIGPWSLRIKTNCTIHIPTQVWFVGYSNNLATNCLLDFQPFGGTNEVVGAMSER